MDAFTSTLYVFAPATDIVNVLSPPLPPTANVAAPTYPLDQSNELSVVIPLLGEPQAVVVAPTCNKYVLCAALLLVQVITTLINKEVVSGKLLISVVVAVLFSVI